MVGRGQMVGQDVRPTYQDDLVARPTKVGRSHDEKLGQRQDQKSGAKLVGQNVEPAAGHEQQAKLVGREVRPTYTIPTHPRPTLDPLGHGSV